MTTVLVAALALAALWPPVNADSRAVKHFDFYRAMEGSAVGAYAIQNFDLASMAGVVKYIQTEVIAEHVIGNPDRQSRKNGISTIMHLRVKVKNPSVLLNKQTIAMQGDFGPFVTYDSGVATNPATQVLIQNYGGFVGAQSQTDVRWPYTVPYYWFSLTGWCPNVRYDRIPVTEEEYEREQATRSRTCQGLSAAACAQEADCLVESGSCVAQDVAPQCLNYTSKFGHSGHVLGGLCPGGQDNLDVDPTGEFGCTYSYGHYAKVNIDKVVGILDEDCGGRSCRDWLDFRQHCSNREYRRKFDAATGKVMSYNYCVEYDIHPACERDCTSESCKQLPVAERELGLPFWRGKCSDKANELRTDLFERASLEGRNPGSHAHPTVDYEETCIYANPGMCTPAAGQGGNYCTRRWAGVCSNCYIPGTRSVWRIKNMPYCPYKVLETKDYKGKFGQPRCKSSLPKDLCCLYTGKCSVRAENAATAPLDENGFALVASWENTTEMTMFLRRAAENSYMEIPAGHDLQHFAATAWSINPRTGASLRGMLDEMVSAGVAQVVTTTTATMTTTTVTSSTSTFTTTLYVAVAFPSSSTWMICGGVVGACLITATLLIMARIRGWCGKSPNGDAQPIAKQSVRDVEAPAMVDVLPQGTPQMSPVVASSPAAPFVAASPGALMVSSSPAAFVPSASPAATQAALPRLLGRTSFQQSPQAGDMQPPKKPSFVQVVTMPAPPAGSPAPSVPSAVPPFGSPVASDEMGVAAEASCRAEEVRASKPMKPVADVHGLESLQAALGITVRCVNDRHRVQDLDDSVVDSNESFSMAQDAGLSDDNLSRENATTVGPGSSGSPAGSGSSEQLPSQGTNVTGTLPSDSSQHQRMLDGSDNWSSEDGAHQASTQNRGSAYCAAFGGANQAQLSSGAHAQDSTSESASMHSNPDQSFAHEAFSNSDSA